MTIFPGLMRFKWLPEFIALAVLLLLLDSPASVFGQDPDAPPNSAAEPNAPDQRGPVADPSTPSLREPPALNAEWQLRALTPDCSVWVDLEKKVVVVPGKVTMRRGPLEMFACPQGTKEYESIVAVAAKSFEVHAALLAIGFVPGRPVKFYPEYQVANGPVVDVQVLWKEADNWESARAQEWVRQVKTGKAMPFDWVFGGSAFWTDEESGERHYMAEGGELICVSNFPSAMMDVPVASPQQNENLWFEPFTEHIPPLNTEVYLVLQRKSIVPAGRD